MLRRKSGAGQFPPGPTVIFQHTITRQERRPVTASTRCKESNLLRCAANSSDRDE